MLNMFVKPIIGEEDTYKTVSHVDILPNFVKLRH
jgi:hypothetical protein